MARKVAVDSIGQCNNAIDVLGEVDLLQVVLKLPLLVAAVSMRTLCFMGVYFYKY